LFLIGRFFKILSSETAWPNEIREDKNVKSKRMTDDRHQVMAKAHIAFGKVF
jgi:hypothetical protein